MAEHSENREIVGTIISLAKSLNLEAIPEGIETKEQAEYLKSLGCALGQDYLYSQPVDALTVTTLIKKGMVKPIQN